MSSLTGATARPYGPRPYEGITWDWAEARRGFAAALPALPIAAATNVSLEVIFALGTLPVVMAGLPRERRGRVKLIAVSVLFAASYAIGCVVSATGSSRRSRARFWPWRSARLVAGRVPAAA